MILQALNEYYERLAGEDGADIPLRGFSRAKVSFALEIGRSGELQQVLDLRDMTDKKPRPRQLVVPAAVKRTVAVAANFLWDNTGYVLGADAKGKPERARETFEAFRDKLATVADGLHDDALAAVMAFLGRWNPQDATELEFWPEMEGQNVVFRLAGEARFVHERPAVRERWLSHYASSASESLGQCLVTGDIAPIARIHPSIMGIAGGQTSGGAIVSFNQRSFESYGKEKQNGLNAPISEAATFNYTTALNDLLKTGSRQKIQIGDATTVFWTDRKTESEGLFGWVFSQKEDQGDMNKLRLFLQAARDGKMPERLEGEGLARCFVLGLAPSTARLSVRFWHVGSVGTMWTTIGRHFADLRIVKSRDTDPDFPPMWQLLKSTARLEDFDNLSPLLSGAFMRSILTGGAYPESLLSTVLGRIRAEQKIGYIRAAIIKACLVRNARLAGKPQEVTVSLDESSTNPGYRLGRLFAVLEKLQQEALNNPNTTIKDRYFGAASATPRSVFPTLLRLAQHHIAKLEYGYAYDNRIARILDGLNDYPSHLHLEDQGLFSLGYYHQRTDLWTKKAAPETANNSTEQ